MEGRPRLTIVGAGNVAWSLAQALAQKADVRQVYSRNFEHAQELASKITDCKPIDSLSAIDTDADFCIISVRDDAVADVAADMPKIQGIVAHTSGSVPMQALDPERHGRIGVFYPLQTFSKPNAMPLAEVPFFIEGNSPDTCRQLKALAAMVSNRVYQADSQQRATLHIAGVFACNFTNHLWGIAAELLQRDGYALDVLKPLLQETLAKAMRMHPFQAQTGPAARGDSRVIEKHRQRLQGLDLDIYDILTTSIINHKK